MTRSSLFEHLGGNLGCRILQVLSWLVRLGSGEPSPCVVELALRKRKQLASCHVARSLNQERAPNDLSFQMIGHSPPEIPRHNTRRRDHLRLYRKVIDPPRRRATCNSHFQRLKREITGRRLCWTVFVTDSILLKGLGKVVRGHDSVMMAFIFYITLRNAYLLT
ncbi:hypothetical protein EDB81DRAFT_816040 [Dactylonectria macrodidyma]|uniref:Uncharacterized protein n=1 Tax=Dactylonectria macrodidyma TaxID=307937 RepID=A0A9P9DEY5_9HYPO|nr:hypothetical protein EDB81DRAFT_816040 [Dactylonectria macrodidyma]